MTYFDPTKDDPARTPIHIQLQALGHFVKAGKVRAIGLSNETPYGVHEFVRLAETYGLPRVAIGAYGTVDATPGHEPARASVPARTSRRRTSPTVGPAAGTAAS